MARDMMLEAVESRFGALKSPAPLEWLTDNGSAYTPRRRATSPQRSISLPASRQSRAPSSNGMSESFVKTFKRDYVRVNPLPDAVGTQARRMVRGRQREP